MQVYRNSKDVRYFVIDGEVHCTDDHGKLHLSVISMGVYLDAIARGIFTFVCVVKPFEYEFMKRHIESISTKS